MHYKYVIRAWSHARLGLATQKMRENSFAPDQPCFVGLDLWDKKPAIIQGLSNRGASQTGAVRKAGLSAIADRDIHQVIAQRNRFFTYRWVAPPQLRAEE
jgi:hypothetical protein